MLASAARRLGIALAFLSVFDVKAINPGLKEALRRGCESFGAGIALLAELTSH
jgi:hypothetical protein